MSLTGCVEPASTPVSSDADAAPETIVDSTPGRAHALTVDDNAAYVSTASSTHLGEKVGKNSYESYDDGRGALSTFALPAAPAMTEVAGRFVLPRPTSVLRLGEYVFFDGDGSHLRRVRLADHTVEAFATEFNTEYVTNGELVTDGESVLGETNEPGTIGRLGIDGKWSTFRVPTGGNFSVRARLAKVGDGYLYFPTTCLLGAHRNEIAGCPESGAYRMPASGVGPLEASLVVPLERDWVPVAVAVHGEDIYLAVRRPNDANQFYYGTHGGAPRLLFGLRYDYLNMTATGEGVVVCTRRASFGVPPIFYLPKEGSPRLLALGSCSSMVWRNGHLYWTGDGEGVRHVPLP